MRRKLLERTLSLLQKYYSGHDDFEHAIIAEIKEGLAKPEPVKLEFPTMLRKMWSGAEVQHWIDEQIPIYATPQQKPLPEHK